MDPTPAGRVALRSWASASRRPTSTRGWSAALAGLLLVLCLAAGCRDPWDPQRAEALWTEHCARCHGDDGRGQARLRVLSPRINLFESEMVQRGPLAGRSIRAAIAEGFGGMPGFEHQLEPAEIDLLTGWVAGLANERVDQPQHSAAQEE